MKVIFCLLAIFSVAAAKPKTLSELGLQPFADGQYLLSSFISSWVDASNFCKSIGCALADVTTEDEHLLLTSVYASSIPDRVWIGGTDLGTEGNFYWGQSLEDFSADVNLTFWHAGEPSGVTLHGIPEHCVQYRRFNGALLWNDAPCENEYQFICEVKPSVC
ncbi:C-type lectin domain family 4 member K-like [Neocloeon triangulifer]|uniref:C-type lectin domain family 4 member K-like n=1 Tax=Neocloeon triangulifer TaxID=2078957 RepID=UPI00286ED908|nr:C-type lectin domain family 4 member K-like [Neocloeon triangulifer]